MKKIRPKKITYIIYGIWYSICIKFQKMQTNLEWQKADHWVPRGRGFQRSPGKLLGMIDMLIIMMVLQCILSLKCIKLYSLNMCSLLYVSYTSIKHFKKNSPVPFHMFLSLQYAHTALEMRKILWNGQRNLSTLKLSTRVVCMLVVSHGFQLCQYISALLLIEKRPPHSSLLSFSCLPSFFSPLLCPSFSPSLPSSLSPFPFSLPSPSLSFFPSPHSISFLSLPLSLLPPVLISLFPFSVFLSFSFSVSLLSPPISLSLSPFLFRSHSCSLSENTFLQLSRQLWETWQHS